MQVFQNFDDIIDMYDPADFDDMVRECDLDQDGKLSYQEFLTCMRYEETENEQQQQQK